MAVQDLAAASRFQVGQVVSKSLSIWLRNILFFLAIGMLAHLPSLLYQLAFPVVPDPQNPMSGVKATVPAALIDGVLAQLMTAIVTYAVVQQLRGQPVRFGAALAGGLGRFFPVLLTSLCAGVLIGLASLAFVIPGIILMMVFWVAVPACVSEKLAVGASLSRSAALTKGYRWQVFGIVLLLGVLSLVAAFILGGAVGFGLGVAHVALASIGVVAEFIANAVVGSLAAACAAVGYYYLRVVKEGVDIDQIAAVFD